MFDLVERYLEDTYDSVGRALSPDYSLDSGGEIFDYIETPSRNGGGSGYGITTSGNATYEDLF